MRFCAVVAVMAAVGCEAPSDMHQARASYDPFTARLILIAADQDRDGRLDQWTYLDGNRPLRGEGDSDGDGRVDRWEYFDADGQLVRIGSSSRNDGVEDTWAQVRAVNGESRIDRSRGRDRHIDRREYLVNDVLVRAEEDTNRDGRIDKWEAYDAEGRLRSVAFDTAGLGRPDRRLVYTADGQARAEADPTGGGQWQPVP